MYGPSNSIILTYLISLLAKLIGFKETNAEIHDEFYIKGGTEKDRIRYDLGFLRRLLYDSNGNYLKIFVSYIFYFSVRILGRKYFNYTK